MSDITLSQSADQMAGKLGLDKDKLKALIADILKICKEEDRSVAGEIVAGLDVNGPIVDPDDGELKPYPGANDAISYLISQPGIEVTLCTGWDLNSMGFFKENRLKVEGLGTVGEYGMTYERNGEFRYLYPYSEDQALSFIKGVLEMVAEHDVKVGIQGNYSTGAGALYIEGDTNGNVLDHPLVKGRRPSAEQLFKAITENGTEATLDSASGKITFSIAKENMKGLYQAMVKIHPLISVRVEKASEGKLSIWIDDKDKPGFDFEALKALVPEFEKYTGRKALVYEDFGVDLMAPDVESGNYSKDSGLREYGREAFGNDDFLSIIIGDKRNDIPRTMTRTMMAAQANTQAGDLVKDMPELPAFYPIDVRDFAVALAEAHRIAQGK